MASIVQDISASSSAAPSQAVSVAAPVAGHALVAWANSDDVVLTPTDNGTGAAWSLVSTVLDGNGCYVWHKMAAAGDTTMTTVTFGQSGAISTSIEAGMIEISGVTGFDTQGTATIISGGATTLATNSAAATTTGTHGDFLLHFGMLHSGGTASLQPSAVSWTNGFTQADNYFLPETGPAAIDTLIGTLVQGTAGAISTVVSWTNPWEDCQGLLVAFAMAAPPAFIAPPPVQVRQSVMRSTFGP